MGMVPSSGKGNLQTVMVAPHSPAVAVKNLRWTVVIFVVEGGHLDWDPWVGLWVGQVWMGSALS